jgi:hypothetical protein
MPRKKYIVIIAVGCLVGFLIWMFFPKRHTISESYRIKYTSPDGKYVVSVYPRYSHFMGKFFPVMPGQASDLPGVVCLFDAKTGKLLYQKRVEMVQNIDLVYWSPTNVEIRLFVDWKLPQP